MTRRSIEVEISLDTSQFDRKMRHLADGPDGFTNLKFAATIFKQFTMAQSRIHVETGSLLASGRVDPDSREGQWRGEIVHGRGGVPTGADPGPARDPGKYAIFEYNRGGNHDWIASSGMRSREHEYLDTILEWLRTRVI